MLFIGRGLHPVIAGNGMKQLVLWSIVQDEKVSDGYYYLLLDTPNALNRRLDLPKY